MSTFSTLVGTPPAPPYIKDTSSIAVIPYNGNADVNAFTLLPFLWHKLKEEGLLDLYFRSEASFCDFVRMMSGGLNVLLAVTKKDGVPDKVIGFLTWEYLNYGGAKTAMAGFIFFKEFWDGHTSTDAGKQLITYLFENSEAEVLMGNGAVENRLDRIFMHRLGLKSIARIPKMQRYQGVQCDADLWCVTKEEYFNG